jgi:hypothetical protein
MKIIYLGAEVPSHRNLLVNNGAKAIGISFWGLTRRGLPKTKQYLLSEKLPSDVEVYVDSGGHHANASGLSIRELEEYNASLEEWVAVNFDQITAVTEFDSKVLGPRWIENQRNTFGYELQEKFWPIWHSELGHPALFALSERFSDVAILGQTVDSDLTLAGRSRAIKSQLGTNFHGIACAKPDNLRQVPFSTASTMSWLSPMMRGETIVWDGARLVRYPKKMKDQARKRYKAIIERAGLDFGKILNDDPNEVTKLAIWSYQQLENSLDRKRPDNVNNISNNEPVLSDNSEHIDDPGFAETGIMYPDNSAVEVRKDSRQELLERDPSELKSLPVFSVENETVITTVNGRDIIGESPIIRSSGQSLRQCDSCFVAANCPSFKPQSTCAFNFPVEVKTKDQLKSLLNAIIEMQATRVAFSRFAEELNGGYPDPNTGQEIDRLFKIVKNMKELEENREFVKMTVERQTSGGVLSALFGDKAQTLKEIPNNGFSEEQTTQIIVDHLEQ